MADFELNALLRTDMGKGASRRLRRNADLVPAILYGADKDPQPLSIAHKDLHKACENEAFFSHIITINADGQSQEAILKEITRIYYTRRRLQVDLVLSPPNDPATKLSKELRIQELTATLDAMTGNLFSNAATSANK